MGRLMPFRFSIIHVCAMPRRPIWLKFACEWGGRVLRWEALDGDIWVADAVCQNYPKQSVPAVAESQAPYGE